MKKIVTLLFVFLTLSTGIYAQEASTLSPDNAAQIEPFMTLSGHEQYITALAFSENGTELASLDNGGHVIFWDAAGEVQSEIHAARTEVDFGESLAFVLDDEQIMVAASTGYISLYEQGELVREFETGMSLRGADVAFEGTIIAAGGGDLGTFTYDVLLFYQGDMPYQAVMHLTGHTDFVNSVDFSPDGLLLASGSRDQTVRIWNPIEGTLLHTLEGHADHVETLAFSTDGTRLASGDVSGVVIIWDTATWEPLFTLTDPIPDNMIRKVAWSPDGSLLAVGTSKPEIRLWNTTTSELLTLLEGHQQNITALAFNTAGTVLASGGSESQILLWRVGK